MALRMSKLSLKPVYSVVDYASTYLYLCCVVSVWRYDGEHRCTPDEDPALIMLDSVLLKT